MIFSNKNSGLLSRLNARISALAHTRQGYGVALMVLALAFLSLMTGTQPDLGLRLFAVGEPALSDIVADRDFQVEDTQSTQARREQAAQAQAMVFDLSSAEIANMRERLIKLINQINTAEANPQQLHARLEDQLGTVLAPETVSSLMQEKVQNHILQVVVPWYAEQLQQGVLTDIRALRPAKGGVLIRNLDTGLETFRTKVEDILDIAALNTIFTQTLRNEKQLSVTERRALSQFIPLFVMPTLTLNRETTIAIAEAAAQAVQPVYYRVHKGELVVREGERVTREQHLKLLGLFNRTSGTWRLAESLGVFIISLSFAVGFFVAPSGKPSGALSQRDIYFFIFLLVITGLAAKGLHLIAPRLLQGAFLEVTPFAFPVAAASGLSALIFASRRYFVIGVLAAMFCTLLFKGSLALFFFFFLSAMHYTWLIVRVQNRRDAVLSIAPLFLGLLIIGFGCALIDGIALAQWPALFVCLTINSLFSMFTVFALSPILELVFGYTTRFRLMELMNLEQPLLQELMVNVPGTYHHSIVVANMVEAGAKAIGANSMLCKVAALYHDIGKLAYPDYFIENQFSGPNRHDKLSPAMSALILASHVKKGGEMAAKHQLGEDISDIIRQHHGTGLMKFFYNKALEAGETPKVEDFSYPGPKPQSREAGIVMVADAVEASSRTLSDPTPARIHSHVDSIMKSIFSEGQLDESELTFRDMHKLSENFARILTGLFHQRISYPQLNKVKHSLTQEKPALACNAGKHNG